MIRDIDGIGPRIADADRVGGRQHALDHQREAALLALTDEMVEARTIRRQAWDTHATVLEPVELVDLIGLIAQYVLFALANNAAQVQVEAALDDVPGLDDPIPGT